MSEFSDGSYTTTTVTIEGGMAQKAKKAATRTKKKVDNIAEEIAKVEEQAKLLMSKKIKPYLFAAAGVGFIAGFLVGLIF